MTATAAAYRAGRIVAIGDPDQLRDTHPDADVVTPPDPTAYALGIGPRTSFKQLLAAEAIQQQEAAA